MRRSFLQSSARLPDDSYVELVRSLFEMLLPSVVMSLLFVGVAALAVSVTGDPVLLGFAVAGAALSAARLWVVIACRRVGVTQRIVDREAAARHERAFGFFYVSFAVTLGLFGARAMMLPNDDMQMVVAALLVGYAAGVAAGISLRPRIGGASLVLAVVPSALVCLASMQLFHVALGIVLLALLTGGLHSMQARYRAELDKIEMRRTISGLARRDPLTGLHNRLALGEQFDKIAAAQPTNCLIALHCLDLDRFKPVNDCYGHLAGDELLRLVAGRLVGSLRQGDFAFRIGGDEFVVLQCGMHHSDEADLLARRLIKSLGEPYLIGERNVCVGASIGYVVSRCDEPLEALLARADNALYAIKALGGGAAGDSETKVGKASAVF